MCLKDYIHNGYKLFITFKSLHIRQSFRGIEKRFARFQRKAQRVLLNFVLLPIVALLNELSCRRQNGESAAENTVCVVVVGDGIFDQSVKSLPRGIWRKRPGGQAVKQWLEQFTETCSSVHTNGADMPSVELTKWTRFVKLLIAAGKIHLSFNCAEEY